MSSLTAFRLSRLLVVGAVAAATVALSGCSVINQFTNTTERDDSGQVVEENENADVFEVQVGDCINFEAEAEEVQTVPQIPCAQPHDAEAFSSLMLDDGEFPGLESVTATSDAHCVGPAYEEFVGVAYEESELAATYFYPTEMSWAQGDREVLCLVYDTAGKTEGTLADAAR